MYEKVGTAFLTTLFIFSSFTSAHAERRKIVRRLSMCLPQHFGLHLIHYGQLMYQALQIQLICGSGRKSMTLDEKLWLTNANKLETQALLGQEVTVVDKKGDWVKVLVHGQPTPRNEEGIAGWMPEKQLTYNQEFADKTNEPFVLVTKPTAILYINPSEKHKSLEVSCNTRLPLLSEDTISYRVLLPNGQKA